MNWDHYFLRIAKNVAKNSKCFSKQLGAVLVKDKRILSTGYNGPSIEVRRCNQWAKVDGWPIDNTDNVCPRRKKMGFGSGEGLENCPAAHAERNTILSAAYMGICTKDTTLYAYCHLPCKDCIIELINAGIKEIVYLEGPDYDTLSRAILKDTHITLRPIKEEELNDL